MTIHISLCETLSLWLTVYTKTKSSCTSSISPFISSVPFRIWRITEAENPEMEKQRAFKPKVPISFDVYLFKKRPKASNSFELANEKENRAELNPTLGFDGLQAQGQHGDMKLLREPERSM